MQLPSFPWAPLWLVLVYYHLALTPMQLVRYFLPVQLLLPSFPWAPLWLVLVSFPWATPWLVLVYYHLAWTPMQLVPLFLPMLLSRLLVPLFPALLSRLLVPLFPALLWSDPFRGIPQDLQPIPLLSGWRLTRPADGSPGTSPTR